MNQRANQRSLRPLLPAVITAIVATVALIGCGSEPTVTAADDAGDSGDVAACERRLDTLVQQLRVDVAYDYEPTDSPAALAAMVDAVVTGTLGEFGVEGEYVTAVIDGVEVIAADAGVGSDGNLTMSWYVSPEPLDVDTASGITVLAFLHDGDRDTPTPAIEGLWFACGPDEPARSMIVEPVGLGWPAGPGATPAYLALAVTDPDAVAASAPETFASGSLVCYGELSESSVHDYEAEAVGFGTPQEAVDDWWANGDGRYRDAGDRDRFDEEFDVPEVRYRDDRGNPQLVLQLSEAPAGGWLVTGTEACFYE